MANIIKRVFGKLNRMWNWNIINKKYSDNLSKRAIAKKQKALKRLGFDIGENVRVMGPMFCTAKLHIGDNTFIGRNASFEGNGEIFIGKNVDIAPNVVISTGGHLIGNSERRAEGDGIITTIKIKDGCWIGNRSLIFNNVEVGPGSVVAAGSVVRESVPENVLVAGVPAQIKKDL